jgi:hypothetical protein
MNVVLAAMLGLGIAQPPAPDYYPCNSRKTEFPIQFPAEKIKNTRQLELHVSNDGGQVWQLAAVAPPTQKTFKYTAPSDGRYWFHIVEEDLKGNKIPSNLTVEPPSIKLLFDTKAPAVVFTNVSRNDHEVLVEWKIDDQFPNEEATRVSFRALAVSDAEWLDVTLPAKARGGVKFNPKINGPIVVRVIVSDLVGHQGEGVKEIAAPAIQTSTSLSPTMPSPPSGAATPAAAVIPPPDFGPLGGTTGPIAPAAPIAPSPTPIAPAAPLVPPMAAPTAPVVVAPPAPLTPVPPPAVAVAPSAAAAPSGSSLPTFDPRNSLTPAGGTHPAAGPVIETSRAPVINALRFDLNYQVETRGPSGISRVDLWVTRDDGKSWVWWSQHDGRETAVKVNLATSSNSQPEGLYGFRLVPVSGAGLSDAAPVAGDAPDLRIIVDVTAPNVKIFPAVADPNDPNALVLQWEAADKNFGDDPITLEWCEGPGGPWKSVATVSSDSTAGQGVAAKRLPNTGKYSWHVPTGLPPRVYLKVTAKDSAGNTTEQVTRDPILIDLTKPRAKITGLGTGAAPLPIVRQ